VVTQADAAAYLLRRGLLAPGAIVDGRVVIGDASSRNRNFAVRTDDGPDYLLKQGRDADGAATVAHEAAVYRRLDDLGVDLRAYAPAFHGYDEAEGVLVLELVDGAETLREHHLRTETFLAAVGKALGAALATFHAATRGTYAALPAPWAFSVHRPDVSVFRDISAANIELIKIVQNEPAFGENLDELRRGWTISALAHHDVKWDNVLLTSDGGVRLVDWEAAGPGDPYWDVGAALSQYLSAWLFSIPITGSEPPQQFPALARFPLDTMKDAIRACWSSYANAIGGAPPGALRRTVAYAGARLVQTAFEASQHVQQLTSPVVLHLQLAANMLRRPDAAATQLLELDEPRVA
jgi:Ser/Thr protein kinase RdoA (MazF antagonist)